MIQLSVYVRKICLYRLLLSYKSRAYLGVIGSGGSGLAVAWVLLQVQQSRYKFKIIYRELEFMGLWELAAGYGGCCQAGYRRTGSMD